MPLQLDEMSARARGNYTKTGRGFGSTLTLTQADDTLSALDGLGPEREAKLAEFGYAPTDKQDLIDARAALLESGVLRDAAEAEAEAATKAYEAALKRGKQARRQAQAVLIGSRNGLEEQGVEAAVQAIDVALGGGSSSGADADKLIGQLQGLRIPLAREDVAAVAAARGGPAAIAAIDASIAELRAIEQVRPTKHGTPAETERLNLIDGIIVERARSIRRAARAMALALGQPAIAEPFELKGLYGRRSSSDGGKAPAGPTGPTT